MFIWNSWLSVQIELYQYLQIERRERTHRKKRNGPRSVALDFERGGGKQRQSSEQQRFRKSKDAIKQQKSREQCQKMNKLLEDRPKSGLRSTLDIYESNIQIARRGQPEQQTLYEFNPSSPATQRSFPCDHQQQSFIRKKLVAQTLVAQAYGLTVFMSELKRRNILLPVDKTKYKTMACGVVTESYRKIEHFLLYVCDRRIKQVNYEEIKCIFTSLLHFRRTFKQPQADTFADFIAVTYNLRAVSLRSLRAAQLYSCIQLKLKRKMASKYGCPIFNPKLQLFRPALLKNKDSHTIYALQRLWNQRYEDEMIEFYKSDQQFANMRLYFKQLHPEQLDCFTTASLRSQFFKIMRLCLRQLAHFIQKYGPRNFPKLIALDGERIKTIVRSPGGEFLRLKMLEIYKQAHVGQNKLATLISLINEYIVCKETGHPIRSAQLPAAYPLDRCERRTIGHLAQDMTFDDYLAATGDADIPRAGLSE